MYDCDLDEEKEQQIVRQGGLATLGYLSRARFETMLRTLTPRREMIARTMQFAIEHSYASKVVRTRPSFFLFTLKDRREGKLGYKANGFAY